MEYKQQKGGKERSNLAKIDTMTWGSQNKNLFDLRITCIRTGQENCPMYCSRWLSARGKLFGI